MSRTGRDAGFVITPPVWGILVDRVDEKSVVSQANRPVVTSRPLGRLPVDRQQRLVRRHTTQTELSQVDVATFNSAL
ncbi:MAG TPA: hypothetical protein VF657_07690 [Actinoplanes sp.]|jgi:hypothetical protein